MHKFVPLFPIRCHLRILDEVECTEAERLTTRRENPLPRMESTWLVAFDILASCIKIPFLTALHLGRWHYLLLNCGWCPSCRGTPTSVLLVPCWHEWTGVRQEMSAWKFSIVFHTRQEISHSVIWHLRCSHQRISWTSARQQMSLKLQIVRSVSHNNCNKNFLPEQWYFVQK